MSPSYVPDTTPFQLKPIIFQNPRSDSDFIENTVRYPKTQPKQIGSTRRTRTLPELRPFRPSSSLITLDLQSGSTERKTKCRYMLKVPSPRGVERDV